MNYKTNMKFAEGLNLDKPTFSSPREFIANDIASIWNTIKTCAAENNQADSTLKMRLELIRDNAQKAIDMLNRIEGAKMPELYND